MPRNSPATRNGAAAQFARNFAAARSAFARLPAPGARSVSEIEGMTKTGVFLKHHSVVLGEIRQVLVDSHQVFHWNGELFYERRIGERLDLIPLTSDGAPTKDAAATLSNLFYMKQSQKEE
ncbi:hypothetical protein Pla175_43760 [Pirellulimonas nuda]|uniref:Uncharacterized protein n=1 Tax=Pirellulimonas nuda TaxID=2528009 RepID=A0A518DHS6_9BACT|nr:hypothetical protein [Pirellulimonas nuda]QDU90962.1 hypothetical protein Pla175_43760 [Pirellulimonas nuda]